jgi:predicted MPP superfamily phosphohydrolase
LPVHDEATRQWRLDQIERFQPDYIINLGDWLDADAATRWPNEHEWTLADEYRLLAKDAREISLRAPQAQKVWLLGNHDDNLRAPNRIPKKLREVCSWEQNPDVQAALDGWKTIPYSERHYFRLGHVTFRHGCSAAVNCDRNGAMLHGVVNGLTVGAHTHRPVQPTQVILPGKLPLPYWYANVGCGADWNKMEYVTRSNIALWGHAVGLIQVNLKPRSSAVGCQWECEIKVRKMAHAQRVMGIG